MHEVGQTNVAPVERLVFVGVVLIPFTTKYAFSSIIPPNVTANDDLTAGVCHST